ncbi:glutathione hydrolase 1 proenzyme-like [Anopheles bellator]|uniref:glutathione hydrolase 1 proenzyme-like n=1 Tax=Anopheles bellator TaxID=139047 RepID=UPI002649BDCC|nr:glutathione hydrolase 1 proenzyme-like [Anopheles bellator]
MILNVNRTKLLLVSVLAAIVVVAVVVGLVIGLRSRDPHPKLTGGAVTANGVECAAIGADILRQNGSAVDAAIATLFCEGVTCPQSMGLGGGFLATLYFREGAQAEALIAREVAPAAATADMYVNVTTVTGGLAVAVPGELKGYWELHQRYGRLEWKALVEPTIKLCREGHLVTGYLERILKDRTDRILGEPSLREVFIDPATQLPWREGDRLKRPALAATLEVIADEGVHALYSRNGTLLPRLMNDLKRFGSIITEDDFYKYEPRWVAPVRTSIRKSSQVYSIPLPGSGTLLNYMLNILDNYGELRRDDPLTWHRIIESFKHGYGLRTRVGDPPFVPGVERELTKLTSKTYARFIYEGIEDDRTHSDYQHYGAEFATENDQGTAHVSVLAPNGDAVSVTSTINTINISGRMMKRRTIMTLIIATIVLTIIVLVIVIASRGNTRPAARQHAGAVVANGAECAAIGAQILRLNGSAADAAIATLFCEGVTCPQSMGLGGGFLLTIYDRNNGSIMALNAREVAPAAAQRDMLTSVAKERFNDTRGLTVAVPGELKGYWELHQRYGRLEWKTLVEPTIQLCERGHIVTPYLSRILQRVEPQLHAEPSMREVFINPATNRTWREGDTIKRVQLAASLRIVATEGVDSLYSRNGTLLRDLMKDLRAFGSIITEDDFLNYRPRWEPADTVELASGAQVHSIAIPASGTIQNFMLRILDGYTEMRLKDPLTWHRIVESMKFAYGLRTRLGDPAHTAEARDVIRNMTDPQFATFIRQHLIDDNATHTDFKYYGAEFADVKDQGTAHICVLAPNGDAVSATSTINYLLGAKIRSRSTGIILNDEMDDFSTPGTVNTYGLPASPANFISPGKVPLSSMTPTIVTDKAGNIRMVLGGAGGSRITSATAVMIYRHLVFGDSLTTIMNEKRLHHQLAPMWVDYEPGFDQKILEGLVHKGHQVKEKTPDAGFAAATGIVMDGAFTVNAAFDPRRGGSAEIVNA